MGRQQGYAYLPVRKYGFWNLILDLAMIGITGGLWIIWIIIREIRRG
jgi:hypothetical protein